MAGIDVAALLGFAANSGISDIFITSGSPLIIKKDGGFAPYSEERIMPDSAAEIIRDIFALSYTHSYEELEKTGDCDFSVSIRGVGRFRVSAFKQRGSMAAVVRVVHPTLPEYKALGIPQAVIDLSKKTHGLILVTGPAGSGKSTTLAAIINRINARRNCHILTLEDPIEYLHSHKMSVVNQREVGTDSGSYATALRAALRQSPDVILVGEMRDLETISIALTAAETGTLVLSTLHTLGAAGTIDRIIDVFPPEQQRQIRIQLSMTLQGVIAQQLLPSPTKGRTPVFEIMTATPAIRNMIRESKTHQIENAIYSGTAHDMALMDFSIAQAYKNGDITRETALAYCMNPDVLNKIAAGD